MKKFRFNFALSREIPRLCFGEMPILEKSVVDAFSYNANSDIAVIVPIFFSTHIAKYQTGADIALHGFMKRAMYQAYELLNFTDLREQGIHYYIIAHHTVKNRFRPYLEACQFPEDRIIWSTESTDNYPGHLIKFPFMRKVLRDKKINKVFSFDSAVYFVKERENNVFRYVCRDWQDQPMANLKKVWEKLSANSNHGVFNYDQAIKWNKYPTPLPSEEEYFERISDALSLSVDDFKTFWSNENQSELPYMSGRTLGVHRSVLTDKDFWELLDFWKDFSSIDQTYLSLYWQKYLGEKTDIIVPKNIRWYPQHPVPILHGNIGFLDSSKSMGNQERAIWLEKMEQNVY